VNQELVMLPQPSIHAFVSAARATANED